MFRWIDRYPERVADFRLSKPRGVPYNSPMEIATQERKAVLQQELQRLIGILEADRNTEEVLLFGSIVESPACQRVLRVSGTWR